MDKDTEHLIDAEEGESNCCGAKVVGYICSDCKDHCDVVKNDEDKIDYKLRIEAGLIPTEDFNEDGEREWIASSPAIWDKYEELKTNLENNYDKF